MNRHFEDMIAHENLDEIREIMIRLQDLKNEGSSLVYEMKQLLKKLIALSVEDSELPSPTLFEKQLELEKRMALYQTQFNLVKKEAFIITGDILEIEKNEILLLELEKFKDFQD